MGRTPTTNDRPGRRRGRRLAGSLVALALIATGPAWAESPNKGRVSFSAGNDFTTAYFFRGILQERNGFIMQPYGEVGFNLLTSESEYDVIRSLTLFGGMWNSIHSERTLASGSGPGNWYEADVYGGIKANFFNVVEGKAFYIAYTYPNGAFNTVQEIDTQFSLFDAQWLDKWALNPYVLFAGEFDNTALGTNEGVYTEVGARPSLTIIDSETYPVTMALPLKVGLSLGSYYEGLNGDDDTFGYFAGGPVFSVPLAFIPSDYGAWSVSAGAQIYAFGTNLKQYNQDDNPWVVGTWSVNFAY